MKTENKKCCFEQYPYPENTIYIFVVGKRKVVSIDDLLNNNKAREKEHSEPFRNLFMVSRTLEDAIQELKNNLPEDYVIAAGCTLSELINIEKGTRYLENHFVFGIIEDPKNNEKEILYYKNGISGDFIKVESVGNAYRNYLCSIGPGMLLNSKKINLLIEQMRQVQEGKFGYYCLSEEEKEEFEKAEEAGKAEVEVESAVIEDKCYQ